VCACVVWLPPDTHDHGSGCDVSPHDTTTCSHGIPIISAATRWVSENDSVPRLPMPDWMYIFPSGLMTNSPSNPVDPETNVLTATPTPRTFDPTRCPDCAFRSSQRNISAPLSSACFKNELVQYGRWPRAFGGPTGAFPSGALRRRMATWSMPSFRAAFASTGSNNM
jgi:hypothetical protein